MKFDVSTAVYGPNDTKNNTALGFFDFAKFEEKADKKMNPDTGLPVYSGPVDHLRYGLGMTYTSVTLIPLQSSIIPLSTSY